MKCHLCQKEIEHGVLCKDCAHNAIFCDGCDKWEYKQEDHITVNKVFYITLDDGSEIEQTQEVVLCRKYVMEQINKQKWSWK